MAVEIAAKALRADVIRGDCIEVLKGFPDEHFELIIADPPYYRIAKAAWDRQWGSLEEWAAWCGEWGAECCRVIKDNGSFFAFGDEKQVAYMQVALDGLPWALINGIVWRKSNPTMFKTCRDALRSFLVQGEERLLFYAKDGPTGLQKILPKCLGATQEYLQEGRLRAGLTVKEINAHFGFSLKGAGTASHWFGDLSQPALPLPEYYAELRRWWNAERRNGGPPYLEREYEDLRREYEYLRRPFFGNGETDVWDGPITPKGEKKHGAHPTQKPLWIIRKIIEHTTRPGTLVLDPFLGSGTTAVACAELGRECVGIDMDEEYCQIAERRVAKAQDQLVLVTT